MRRVFVACVTALSLTAFAGAAAAADLPPRYPPPAYKAPPAYGAYNWTGFYLGINGGGGWGRSQWDALDTFDLSGGVIGGTVGYNWQFGQAVIGAEGDIDWSGIKGRARCCVLGGARRATSGSPPPAGGWVLPSTASCPTSPAVSRLATSAPPPRSCRAAASPMSAGPSAPAWKSGW